MKPDVKQDWTDKLRETMSDYQEQPSEKVWAGISRRAGLTGRRSVPVWLWGSCAAAALALGIFFAIDATDDKGGNLTADNIAVIPSETDRPAIIPENIHDEVAEQTDDSDATTGTAPNESGTTAYASTQNTKIGNNNIGGASTENAGKTVRSENSDKNIPAEEARGNEAFEKQSTATGITQSETLESESENVESEGTGAEVVTGKEAVTGEQDTHSDKTEGLGNPAETHTLAGQNADSDKLEDSSEIKAGSEEQKESSEDSADSDKQEDTTVSETAEDAETESEADAWKRYLSENQEKTKKKRGIFSASILANGAGEATGREKIRMSGVLGSNPLDNEYAAGWCDPEFSENEAAMLTDNVPEVEMEYSHKMPVKIGLSVRYDIGTRFGIETGIAYSILNSDIKKGKNLSTWSKGEQTFNYIGIPLNVSFDIFSSRYVDFYASAGGMMEKAVRGRVNLDNYTDGKYVNSTKRSIKPKELEWSANAAVGVQCNILPQLGIFVEPGISYHFKSNAQVKTIYTDRPTNFSIGFGLRWTFLD